MRSTLFFITIVQLLTASVVGHATLQNPLAREGQNSGIGLKTTPRPPSQADLNGCQNSVEGPIQMTYVAGSEIKVEWKVNIEHPSAPGVRIALGYPGEPEFMVLAEGRDALTGTTNVTLPEKPCEKCILHWIWDTAADNGYYLGCSDISILPAGEAPEVLPVEDPIEVQPIQEPEVLPMLPEADMPEEKGPVNPMVPPVMKKMKPEAKKPALRCRPMYKAKPEMKKAEDDAQWPDMKKPGYGMKKPGYEMKKPKMEKAEYDAQWPDMKKSGYGMKKSKHDAKMPEMVKEKYDAQWPDMKKSGYEAKMPASENDGYAPKMEEPAYQEAGAKPYLRS